MKTASTTGNVSLNLLFLGCLLACCLCGCRQDSPAESLLRSGAAKCEKGDLDGAIADYNKALELAPKDPNVLYNRAIVHRRMGDYRAAEADLTSALSTNPKDLDAYLYRAKLRYELGEYDGAVQDNSEALKIDPRSEDAHYGRATSAYRGGKFGEAIKDFEWVIENSTTFEMVKESRRLITLAKQHK